MRHDGIEDAKAIDLTRCYKASDRQIGVSRRAQALLAAAGMDRPDRRWVCLAIKSGKESSVNKVMAKSGIETLIPWLPETIEVRRGRKVTVPPRPLYSEYLLVNTQLTGEAMLGLKGMKHVTDIIGGWIKPHLVSERIINDIMRLTVDDTAILMPDLKAGDRVYVINGPFVFREGAIVSTKGFKAKITFADADRKFDITMPLASIRKL